MTSTAPPPPPLSTEAPSAPAVPPSSSSAAAASALAAPPPGLTNNSDHEFALFDGLDDDDILNPVPFHPPQEQQLEIMQPVQLVQPDQRRQPPAFVMQPPQRSSPPQQQQQQQPPQFGGNGGGGGGYPNLQLGGGGGCGGGPPSQIIMGHSNSTLHHHPDARPTHSTPPFHHVPTQQRRPGSLSSSAAGGGGGGGPPPLIPSSAPPPPPPPPPPMMVNMHQSHSHHSNSSMPAMMACSSNGIGNGNGDDNHIMEVDENRSLAPSECSTNRKRRHMAGERTQKRGRCEDHMSQASRASSAHRRRGGGDAPPSFVSVSTTTSSTAGGGGGGGGHGNASTSGGGGGGALQPKDTPLTVLPNGTTTLIPDWYAVLGDKQSGGRGRTTTATVLLRDVKEWYKEAKSSYRDAGKAHELIDDALQRYFDAVAQAFPIHFPKDTAARKETILIYCSKEALQSGRVAKANCFTYEPAKPPKFGLATVPAAIQFFLESRDAPSLPAVVRKLRRDFDVLRDAHAHLEAGVGPPTDMLQHFEGLLQFCEMQLQAAASQEMAQKLLDKLNLIPALREQWKFLKEHDVSGGGGGGAAAKASRSSGAKSVASATKSTASHTTRGHGDYDYDDNTTMGGRTTTSRSYYSQGPSHHHGGGGGGGGNTNDASVASSSRTPKSRGANTPHGHSHNGGNHSMNFVINTGNNGSSSSNANYSPSNNRAAPSSGGSTHLGKKTAFSRKAAAQKMKAREPHDYRTFNNSSMNNSSSNVMMGCTSNLALVGASGAGFTTMQAGAAGYGGDDGSESESNSCWSSSYWSGHPSVVSAESSVSRTPTSYGAPMGGGGGYGGGTPQQRSLDEESLTDYEGWQAGTNAHNNGNNMADDESQYAGGFRSHEINVMRSFHDSISAMSAVSSVTAATAMLRMEEDEKSAASSYYQGNNNNGNYGPGGPEMDESWNQRALGLGLNKMRLHNDDASVNGGGGMDQSGNSAGFTCGSYSGDSSVASASSRRQRSSSRPSRRTMRRRGGRRNSVRGSSGGNNHMAQPNNPADNGPPPPDVYHVTTISVVDPHGDHGLYTGSISNESGMPHGFGRFEFLKGGRWYEGNWVHGHWTGKGKLSNGDGSHYDGGFQDDLKHGQGTMVWSDGRVFDGIYKQGQIMWGKMTFADGGTYFGYFAEGLQHGKGNMVFADNSKYEGDFEKGNFHGNGKMTWNDGGYYEGEWQDGMIHGVGKEIRADGTLRHEGNWKNGAPVR